MQGKISSVLPGGLQISLGGGRRRERETPPSEQVAKISKAGTLWPKLGEGSRGGGGGGKGGEAAT